MKTSSAAWPADNVAMIEDTEIAAMAAGLARAYGLTDAATKATDYALAALDQGHLGLARTWRRILNVLNRSTASREPMTVQRDPR